MSDYDLDRDAPESFNFVVKGLAYKMRYPTTEEVQAGAQIKDQTEQTAWLYSFITPEAEDSPSIEETLKKVNTKVLKSFNAMIKEEFSLEA